MIVFVGQGQSPTEYGTGVVNVMIEKQVKRAPMERAGDSSVKEFSFDLEKGLNSEEV